MSVKIRRMNGLPLNYTFMCDFNDPKGWTTISSHTSIDTAERSIRRTIRGGESPYGWTWISATGGIDVLREVVSKSQRIWVGALKRAKAESPNSPWLTRASCCPQLTWEFGSHRATARHFRYWCLEDGHRAVGFMPWIREVIASEVLSGVGG